MPLKLPFYLAAAAALALPATALANGPQSRASALVSGDDGEVLELLILLSPHIVVDGESRTASAAECEAGFTLIAADAVGDRPPTVMAFDLMAGDVEEATIPFAEYSYDAVGNIVVSVEMTRRTGPCRLLPSARWADAASGETRSSAAVTYTYRVANLGDAR